MNIVIPIHIESLSQLKIEERPLEPFSEIVLDFIDELSKNILKNALFKQYPELMALAFWMRKSHIEQLRQYFDKQRQNKILFGRGVVFHIAPSNVDTIFIYSWFISMLVGNSNVLRISDKENMQVELLLQTITKILYQDKYITLQERIAIIKYGHDDYITERLSMMADVRVIWGGDGTISHIRTIPIKPTATELTFADKFSLAILKSKELLDTKHIDTLIENFYNDAFWFKQMACSSIRLVVWEGEPKENRKAQRLFWDKLSKYVETHKPKEIIASDVVNKIVAAHALAIEDDAQTIQKDSPFVHRVKLSQINETTVHFHCGSGLFYEYDIENIEDLFPMLTRRYQTIAQFGFSKEEIFSVLLRQRPKGIDRIVPIGKALDFSHIWDGFDLFDSFCREVEIWS